MKNVTVKALLAVAVMGASASSFAAPLMLVADNLRAGSNPASAGTYYNLIFNGSDQLAANGLSPEYVTSGGGPSTATWDWDGSVLTQTGGTLYSNQWIGNTPASGSLLLGDVVTGLVINTGAGTTTAGTYRCNEGNFTGTTGGNGCGNYSYGADTVNNSTRTYNVAGNADCDNIAIGGDDGAAGIHRGLRNWAGGGVNGCGDNSSRGARDMINIVQNNLGIGGTLILANSNLPGGTFDISCLDGAQSGGALFTAGVADCGRVHWMTLTNAPVPAAVWLFGSALGLLGWVRRRARMSA